MTGQQIVTGQPVKWVEDRLEHLSAATAAGHGLRRRVAKVVANRADNSSGRSMTKPFIFV